MDRSLLKNIIIIILLLTNGFLLASLGLRQTDAANARRQTEEQLIQLFAADGMTLEKGAFSSKTPPSSLSLSRSTQLEQKAAAFFLGDSAVLEDQGGGTRSYTSAPGVARFRSNGRFDIAGSLASGDVEALCRRFCQKFSYEAPVFTLDADGTGTGTAVSSYGGLPVFNCGITFTVDHGTLLTVSGTLLPEEGTAMAEEQSPLSAAAALTAFQKMRRESGAVVSAVTDTYLCYELQSSSALSLAPAWCIVTDTKSYYVNCITGAVSTG